MPILVAISAIRLAMKPFDMAAYNQAQPPPSGAPPVGNGPSAIFGTLGLFLRVLSQGCHLTILAPLVVKF
jgi:hypothetical protein